MGDYYTHERSSTAQSMIVPEPVDSNTDEMLDTSPWYNMDYRPRLHDYFDDTHLKYLCCHNRLHIRTASYLVALIEMLLLMLRLGDLVFVSMHNLCLRLMLNSLEIGVCFFCWMLLLAGLRLKSANLLVPNLVVQITYIMLLIGVLTVTLLFCVFGDGHQVLVFMLGYDQFIQMHSSSTDLLLGAFVLILAALLFITSYLLSILVRCHNYFLDFDRYMAESSVTPI